MPENRPHDSGTFFQAAASHHSAWAAVLAGAGTVHFVLGGVGFWWLEPKVRSLSDGLWLAFTTAATVGYGDLVPTTLASRSFSVVVVLLGLAVLSLVTASLAAIFIEREVEEEERQIERDLRRDIMQLRNELHLLRQELREALAPQTDLPRDL